jgi:CRP/FNR family transcriptional regulator
MALSSSIAGRVAHLLLERAFGPEGESREVQPTVNMRLKHEELASMLGSSRESVTRVLSSFRRKGFIEVRGPSMKVLRREALEMLL